jgi:hypothetical protein
LSSGDRAFESQLASRDLQALDEIAGAREQYAPAVFDERETDGGCQMILAAAGRAEQEQIGAARSISIRLRFLALRRPTTSSMKRR